MAQSFYFYDTETSGTRASGDRIMQFAGRRTTLDLEPIGEPDDILIQLPPDILPEPDAVLIHGVTPQRALQDGITEAAFCKYFQEHIALPDTIFVGFNSVRFDDEFVRYTMYRNFYEPYEWQWKDGRSRWDLLDALRMMRALRPEGIEWPFQDDKPTVRLELMTKANGIAHENAHTALADVDATIALAKLMSTAQPKLFAYLFGVRSKKDIAAVVESGKPFVYTSGKYDGNHLKTTVATTLFKHPKRDAAIVYDLRFDPTELAKLSIDELSERWRAKYGSGSERLPLKTLQYNRCPAIAPLGVLDEESQKRIHVDVPVVQRHMELLQDMPELITKLQQALDMLEAAQTEMRLDTHDVDMQLYDSFWSERERHVLQEVRHHAPATLADLLGKISNKRMQKLLPLYKARNYPSLLTPEERDAYEVYRHDKLLQGGEESKLARYMKRLHELAVSRTSKQDQYLLTELQLYAESIAPFISD